METLEQAAGRIWDETNRKIAITGAQFPTDFARRLIAWREGQQEPDGEVVACTGSMNDLVVIKWISDYHPKVGDKIYAFPPAKLDSNDVIEALRRLCALKHIKRGIEDGTSTELERLYYEKYKEEAWEAADRALKIAPDRTAAGQELRSTTVDPVSDGPTPAHAAATVNVPSGPRMHYENTGIVHVVCKCPRCTAAVEGESK